MSHRFTGFILGLAMAVIPAMSFALNAEAVASAKSCCEDMANSCAGSKTPLECCDKNLVTAESTAAFSKLAPHVAPPATYVCTISSGESQQVQHAFQYIGLPLASGSPPIVLRI
jgi:hypothetical protein